MIHSDFVQAALAVNTQVTKEASVKITCTGVKNNGNMGKKYQRFNNLITNLLQETSLLVATAERVLRDIALPSDHKTHGHLRRYGYKPKLQV